MFSKRNSINTRNKKDSQSHHLSTRIEKEEPTVLCYNNSDSYCSNGRKQQTDTVNIFANDYIM